MLSLHFIRQNRQRANLLILSHGNRILVSLTIFRITLNTDYKNLWLFLEDVSWEAYRVTVDDKSFTAWPKKKKSCAGDVLKPLLYNAVLSCHPCTLCLSALLSLTFLFVSFLLLNTSAIWVKIFCLFLQSAEYNIGIPIQP